MPNFLGIPLLAMNTRRKIIVSRTQGEWDCISQNYKNSNFGSFLRREIIKLEKKFNECPECVTLAEGEKKSKFYRIDQDSFAFLQALSKAMKKPISTVVDELIINPILTRHR